MIAIEKTLDREGLEGVIGILKVWLEKLFYEKIDRVEVLETDYYILNPINEFGKSLIYKDKENNIDIKKILNYKLLSNSPLSRYIIENEKLDLNVKYVDDIAIVPLNTTETTIFEFEMYLQKYEKTFFTYDFGINMDEDAEAVKQLCNMFEIQVVDSRNFLSYVLQTETDFYISPELWLRTNLSYVKNGNFPCFTFKYVIESEYDERYGTIYTKYILKYCAYLAYAQLSDNNKIIRSYITWIRINEDFSISVHLPTLNLCREYIKIFKDLCESKTKFTIENCENYEEGIIKRYIIQTIDNDAYPILFATSANIKELIVHRSPLANKYPSPFVFDKSNIDKAKLELTNKCREYYKICHDNIDPVSLEAISQMNLMELLHLIPITENKITYCFSSDTLSKIEFNPMTRTILSEKTKKLNENLEYGLRGLFDVAVLYGLLDLKNEDKNFEDIGLTKIVRISVPKEYRELYGNVYRVEVVFTDNTVSDLFEISLPTVNLEKLDELKTVVARLWKKGYFLNSWQLALLEYLKIKSFSFVSKQNALSIHDGEKTLEKLSNF